MFLEKITANDANQKTTRRVSEKAEGSRERIVDFSRIHHHLNALATDLFKVCSLHRMLQKLDVWILLCGGSALPVVFKKHGWVAFAVFHQLTPEARGIGPTTA